MSEDDSGGSKKAGKAAKPKKEVVAIEVAVKDEVPAKVTLRRVDVLREKIRDFPTQSGVYLMKSEADKIIYVGKAKNLKNRVRSYFSESPDLSAKTRYLMKNALIATVSMMGFLIGFQLGGAVLIEYVLDWPGIGQYALKAALQLDFQPIMGSTLFIGCVVVLVNLITDLLYRVIDPRIGLS